MRHTVRAPCGMMKASPGFTSVLAALRVFNLGGAFGNDAQLRARMAGKFKRARPAIPYARVHFPRGMGDVPPDIGERIAVQNMLGGGRAHVPRPVPFPEKSVLCPLLLQFFERCSFNLNLDVLFPNPKSLSSLLFFFS